MVYITYGHGQPLHRCARRTLAGCLAQVRPGSREAQAQQKGAKGV